MKAGISKSVISGEIIVPSSKSYTQRALAAALLHKGNTVIQHAGNSNDESAALKIIETLGAKVESKGDSLYISSDFYQRKRSEQTIIDCGESGLAIRMFTPIVSLLHDSFFITGSGSLLSRPMNFFDEVLPQLSISIHSDKGKIPLTVQGPLHPKEIIIDGSKSSQFLTGLLFAFGEAVKEETTITVKDLKSRPYTDLTLDVMRHFGYRIVHENYERFIISPKNDLPGEIIIQSEGDWSNAAFLLVAGAIGGSVRLSGLNINSLQADRAIVHLLQQCGANTEIMHDHISVSGGDLKVFHFDATNCPDLFPPLVALAVHCKGSSRISGVHRLHNKESDRAASLKNVFEKMGVAILIEGDDMIIMPPVIFKSAEISSHGDHRIVMAAAVAALGGESVTITEAEAVNKSYPGFFDDLQNAGASVSLLQ